MIVPLPKRPANDDQPLHGWFCRACQNEYFILASNAGVTTIHCADCGEDVTAHVTPTLAVGVDLCQP